MKQSKAHVASRRDKITALLERRGRASVSELAERFGVSALTIRRDLDYLESQHILTRQYGAATLLSPLGRPSGSMQVRASRAIAREAARLVEDGDCIFINGSSTALGMLEFITAQGVTVITNNGRALMLKARQNVSVLLTGGEIRPPRHTMTGEIALEAVRRITAAKSFLGCTGLSADFGLTSATSAEPAVSGVMLERSRQHVVVCDSSKIGLTSSFRFGSAEQVDLLITDTGVDEEQALLLEAHGIGEIVRVEPELFSADCGPASGA